MGWQNDPIVGQAPTQQAGPPAFIPGTPKPVTPAQQQDMTIQASKEQRDAQKDALIIQEKQMDLAGGVEAKAIEAERKAAAFLIRAMGSNEDYEATGVGPRSLVGQGMADTMPSVLNSLPASIGNSPERQVSDSAQNEFIAATLRQDSGAAIPPDELERQRQMYFPMPGDGPDAIAQKRRARIRAIEGLKQSAGRLEASAEQRYNALVSSEGRRNDGTAPLPAGQRPPGGGTTPPPGPVSPDMTGGVPTGTQVDLNLNNWLGPDGTFDRDAALMDLYGITPNQEAQISAFWNANRGNPGLTAEGVKQWYDNMGLPLPADIEGAVQQAREGKSNYGTYDLKNLEDARKALIEREAASLNERIGERGAMDLAAQGLTLGLLDESSGIGTALGRGLQGDFNVADNYRIGRDAERLRLEQARERTGWAGTAAEVVGGVASGGVGEIGTAGQAAKAGATAGAVGGFGYGEGTQGSLAGAAFGAGAGAALGAGGFKLGEKLAARAARQAETRAAGSEIAQAGQAEGVTVNRAMVDPSTRNRVSRTDASVFGGDTIRRGMQDVEGQIAGRVSELGAGKPMGDMEAGNTLKGAAERFIKETGESARIKYDRAEKMAEGIKIAPQESLRRVDDMLSALKETPASNSAEINFLETLKSDLAKDLSVSALRRMRTQLRQRISKGELTFGEDEARVLSIMDGAAEDIRAGLSAAGKEGAARAFDAADKAYRARMEYITGTIQKVVGRRNANLSPEQVFTRFQAMAKGRDAGGLRKFYASLSPDEAADVSATFAEQLGKNIRGDFSTAYFLSQTEKFSPEALVTIFGRDGAASIKNLRTLSEASQSVTSAMNSRTSKSGVANYRTWLFDLLLGGAAGAAHGSVGTATTVAAGAAATSAATQYLSARALMSPKITKWITTAPATSSSKAIDAHFERLAEIARAEPSLASEIDALRTGIMQAANDNVGLPAAAGDAEENQQKK